MTDKQVPLTSDAPALQCEFDIHDHDQVDRIYDVYAELRESSPVVYSSQYGGHWVITGHDEIKQVCRNHEVYSSEHVNIPENIGQDGPMIPIEVDPPDHAEYRRLLTPLFSPPRMKALESEIEVIVEQLLNDMENHDKVDFIEAFAKPLPSIVFLALVGWPQEDAPKLQDWVDRIVLGLPGATEEETTAYREEAAMEAYAYFAEVLDERMEHPENFPDDVTGALIGGQFEDRELTQFEVLNMLFLIMIAGLDTVQGALAHSVMHFAKNPSDRLKLSSDPDVVPTAVEEMLRYESAVSPARVVKADAVLAGVQMREGDRVLFSYGAANRDPAAFENPDEVDLTRNPNPHLAFGAGVHRCLGSHLARIELNVAFMRLHERFPDYRLDPADPPKMHLSQLKSVETLPLILGESI